MKLYAVKKSGLVPCILLKSTGPYTEGKTVGFSPEKAKELIEKGVVELSAKLSENDAKKLGIEYVDVVAKVEPKSDNASVVEAQKAAEKAQAEADTAKAKSDEQAKQIKDLQAQLAAKSNPQK